MFQHERGKEYDSMHNKAAYKLYYSMLSAICQGG